jgi:hypothetical protein
MAEIENGEILARSARLSSNVASPVMWVCIGAATFGFFFNENETYLS